MEATGPDQYQAVLTVGIAVVKGKYTGSVRLSDKEPPQRFRLQVEGKGTGGFVQGSGLLELAEDAEGTKVTYQGDVQVGGPIASIGQRLLDGAAKMMVGHFFTAVSVSGKDNLRGFGRNFGNRNAKNSILNFFRLGFGERVSGSCQGGDCH